MSNEDLFKSFEPALVQAFGWNHLQDMNARAVSRTFHDQMRFIMREVPPGFFRVEALRCLLAAKDAAVRAVLPQPAPQPPSEPQAHEPHAASDLPPHLQDKESWRGVNMTLLTLWQGWRNPDTVMQCDVIDPEFGRCERSVHEPGTLHYSKVSRGCQAELALPHSGQWLS